MGEKSHVSLEQKICPVCGTTFDSGAILLDRRLRPSFEMHTTTGYDLCPEHQKLHDDGYVALVECTNGGSDADMKVWEANRTGRVAHIKRDAFKRVFNVPLDPKLPMTFVDAEVIDKLQKMQEGS